MPSTIATHAVPEVLKSNFNVDKVVWSEQHNGHCLRCVPDTELPATSFFLFLGLDPLGTPSLWIYIFGEEEYEFTAQPVYPFQASEMPESVQGMINMAEQWSLNLNM